MTNQRLLNGIGGQNDRGHLLRFLFHPGVEPTNNRAERILRPAVIARKVSQCSKNQRGAEAFSAFVSVLQTARKLRKAVRYSISHMKKQKRSQFASVARSARIVVWAAQTEFICPDECDVSRDRLLAFIDSMTSSDEVFHRDLGSSDDSMSSEWADATIFNAKGKVLSMLVKATVARASF